MIGIFPPQSPPAEKFWGLTLKEIESYFLHSIECSKIDWTDEEDLLCKMCKMNYKDEPDFDNEGKPILRRTTPLHLMARGDLPKTHMDYYTARDLFKVYDQFGLNYIDEFGLTHFHVACRYDCKRVVREFLDFGQVDPNLPVQKTHDTPLLLALNWRHKELARLLLRYGADPNLPNVNGLRPLHVTCQTGRCGDMAQYFFDVIDELNLPVRVNIRDKFGSTPLHFAVHYGDKETVKFLLRRGAHSNWRNSEGSTPLHIICHRQNNDDLARLFFEINEERNQPVQVNVKDIHGRTPLQLAVFYLSLDIVDLLIKKGADPSSFVFPTDIYCGQEIGPPELRRRINYKLRLASGVLLIVERLKTSGYELERSDVSTIMNVIAKHGLFEKSAYVEQRLLVDRDFEVEANKLMVKPDLSLCDLIRLPPEVARNRVTFQEYFDLSTSSKFRISYQEACVVHLCEKLTRKFFQFWALSPFWNLIHYRLPILCSGMILENLNNEDLYKICLVAQELFNGNCNKM